MVTPSISMRFWNKVALPDSIGTDQCWDWLGKPHDSGYGRFSIGHRIIRAHRFAYELVVGPIPDGLFVCHSCDNRLCCNPAHLWLGSCADNLADMVRKGRSATGEKNGMKKHPERTPQGIRNGSAKLTERQVIEIRESELSAVTIAIQYKVSYGLVKMIRAYQVWKHI